jgi:hypothetical protein
MEHRAASRRSRLRSRAAHVAASSCAHGGHNQGETHQPIVSARPAAVATRGVDVTLLRRAWIAISRSKRDARVRLIREHPLVGATARARSPPASARRPPPGNLRRAPGSPHDHRRGAGVLERPRASTPREPGSRDARPPARGGTRPALGAFDGVEPAASSSRLGSRAFDRSHRRRQVADAVAVSASEVERRGAPTSARCVRSSTAPGKGRRDRRPQPTPSSASRSSRSPGIASSALRRSRSPPHVVQLLVLTAPMAGGDGASSPWCRRSSDER